MGPNLSNLDAAIARGFAVTAELSPPAGPDSAAIRAAADALRGVVDAVNVPDNPAATVRMSALGCAAILMQEGVEPILQLAARDRNLLAVQSELLSAWAFGVRTVLALSGDPLKVGRYDGRATHLRDVDSLGLTELIVGMNAGRLAADEELANPTGFRIVGAANPLVDSVERLAAKVGAGVSVLQTNVVYDVARFVEWFGPVVAAGIPARAPVLVGIMPPRSTRMLQHMHDHIPGVEVDPPTFARMEGLTGAAARAEGIAIAAELVEQLREVPGVGGVHLMAPGWETEAVPAIVERVSIAPAGRPAEN